MPTVVFPSAPLSDANKPKELVASEGCYMLITANIRVNRVREHLVGNTVV